MKILSPLTNQIYTISNPDKQLWSAVDLYRAATASGYPRLPIGLRSRPCLCQHERVRGTSSDKVSKLYLVTRISNGRMVKFSRERFTNI